jgi:hypothetical protein
MRIIFLYFFCSFRNHFSPSVLAIVNDDFLDRQSSSLISQQCSTTSRERRDPAFSKGHFGTIFGTRSDDIPNVQTSRVHYTVYTMYTHNTVSYCIIHYFSIPSLLL